MVKKCNAEANTSLHKAERYMYSNVTATTPRHRAWLHLFELASSSD